MDLNDSDVQVLLCETVRSVLNANADATARNAAERSDLGIIEGVERSLGEIGLLEAIVQSAISPTCLASVFEEVGRFAVASPIVNAMAAYEFVRYAAGQSAARDLYDRVGQDLSLGVRRQFATGRSHESITISWSHMARWALVYNPHGGSPVLELFELDEPGEPQPSLDAERSSRVQLPINQGDVIVGDDRSPFHAGRQGDHVVKLLRSAGLTGLAAGALDLTVGYVRDRRQFKRPIGSFQSIQHELANIWIRLTGTRLATYEALWLIDHGVGEDRLSMGAVLQACIVAEEATLAAAQFHGGIGFTTDYGLHHFLRRAKAEALRLGGQLGTSENLAAIIGDEGTVDFRHLPPTNSELRGSTADIAFVTQ